VPLLLLAAAFAGAAEERSPLLKDPEPPPPAPPYQPHVVSSEMAAKLASVAPRFTPPAALARKDPVVESHDADKPRNGIVRLPRYLVLETRIPDFPQRRMLTPLGRVDLALKRHPGLKFGPLAFLNNGIGLAMLEEEERLERLAEMNDLFSLLPNPKSSETKAVKHGMDGSFIDR
jgi:hypothetical protein